MHSFLLQALRTVEFNGMNTINDHYCDTYRNAFEALGVVSSNRKKEEESKEEEEPSTTFCGLENLCGGS